MPGIETRWRMREDGGQNERLTKHTNHLISINRI